MEQVYCHPNTQRVYELHLKTIEATDAATTVLDQLTAFSENLWTAWKSKNPVCKGQINNWHPDYIGKELDVIFQANFTIADAQLSIAKDCGFLDWEEVEQLGKILFDLDFEKAVDTLLKGDLAALKQQVENQPELLSMRSKYGHQATLLHYAGSNGVEMWRQKTPYNLPEIVRFLLGAGADKNATMRVYGGDYSTLELAVTSAHPHSTGVVEELKQILG